MEATRYVNITNFNLLECLIHYFSSIQVGCMKLISFRLQETNNFFCILDFESLKFDLLLVKFLFQQGTYSIYFTFAMPCGKMVPKDLITWRKLHTNYHVVVPTQKIPSPNTLKLTRTTITPDNVMLKLTPFKFKKLPMQLESMLEK